MLHIYEILITNLSSFMSLIWLRYSWAASKMYINISNNIKSIKVTILAIIYKHIRHESKGGSRENGLNDIAFAPRRSMVKPGLLWV